MTEIEPTATVPSTMRRDIASAYFAAASRVGSWVIVSALVFRFLGPLEFAMLALVRGTIGLLNYVTLGIAPALVHIGARSEASSAGDAGRATRGSHPVLDYWPGKIPDTSLSALYTNGLVITYCAAFLGFFLSLVYAIEFDRLYQVPVSQTYHIAYVVVLLGVGLVLRFIGDAPGAVLQVRERIALDNLLAASGDLLWLLGCLLVVLGGMRDGSGLMAVAECYAASGLVPWISRRLAAAAFASPTPKLRSLDWRIIRHLLSYGSLIVLAQLADYLYSPTDYILINRLLGPLDVASYAPAVQIDSGLLLLVGGLSSVLLPKAAIAHAGGQLQTVRRYYVRGTAASFAVLAVASVLIWLASPWIFRLWLGNSMPATRAILPLILLNTTIGGSAAAGRSVLLAVGRAKPFAVSVLIAGIGNVVCSYAFVRYLHWGLAGIVLGTVIAVIARCVFWMPWYVCKTLGGK